jgi:hypothetical protein
MVLEEGSRMWRKYESRAFGAGDNSVSAEADVRHIAEAADTCKTPLITGSALAASCEWSCRHALEIEICKHMTSHKH